MLHLLIVPSRARSKSDSADGVRLHKVDDIRQGVIWSTKHRNEKLRLPVVSTGVGSGTSAVDAIVVDSDEDMSGVSCFPCTDTPWKELPINHDTSLNQDVISYSDSDIELIESKGEDEPETSCHSLPLARDLSPAGVSSDPPPSRPLTRERDGLALCGLRPDGTDVTTSDSDSEADEGDKEANGTEDVDGSRIFARHANPPSLKPIRRLLAGRRRRGNPEGEVLPEGILVAPRASQKQGGRELLEEAPAITSSESDEESGRQASDPQLKRVFLPKTDHGRARRLLMPESADLALVAVTMRGDCHFIERKKK